MLPSKAGRPPPKKLTSEQAKLNHEKLHTKMFLFEVKRSYYKTDRRWSRLEKNTFELVPIERLSLTLYIGFSSPVQRAFLVMQFTVNILQPIPKAIY